MISLRVCAIGTLAVAATVVWSQGLNIDFDSNGRPSSTFGAASHQVGFWNHARYDGFLQSLAGGRSNVRMVTSGIGGAGSNYNPANTGDFEKLLNDGAQVGTVVQGGRAHVTITGLDAGSYRIFTYAVQPYGDSSYAPVYVPQAIEDSVQVVTGPMPGNSFEHLITHSIHEVVLSAGEKVEIIVDRKPNSPSATLNGFQIVPVGGVYGPTVAGARRGLTLRDLLTVGVLADTI